ncbi:MAG: superoxide dismutase [Aquabacterium sp.]
MTDPALLHTLPPLPYGLEALAPAISARTLTHHHGSHHQGYVDELNRLSAGTAYAGMALDQVIGASRGRAGQTKVYSNAAQAWNHAFYWRSLRPFADPLKLDDLPGVIRSLVSASFGSIDACRDAFIAAAGARLGSGWVWLVLENGRLDVIDTANADAPSPARQRPLLVIDVWEHAYYLDVQQRRGAHVEAVFDHLLNWAFAADNLT